MEPGGGRHFVSVCLLVAAVAVPLLVAGLAAEPGAPGAERGLSPRQVAALAPRVAAGVAELRGLEFDRPPRARIVGVDELRRLYDRELERLDRRQDLDAQAAVLRHLGLLDADDGLREIAAATVELVAGAYDPRTGRLVVVESGKRLAPALVEFILAHELVHALEDEHFDLRRIDRFGDDRLLAAQALVEGSATYLMVEYALRFQEPFELLDATLDPEIAESASGTGLPDFVEAQLVFPYMRGMAFVRRLVVLGGDWDLVDVAYRERLPLSTEQILHPAKYLAFEPPARPGLDLRVTLGAGWRQTDRGEIGEFDTIQLLRTGAGASAARRAASGWGGGRYELWRRGPASRDCEQPCRSRELLALAWSWDTPSDAREFARLLPSYLEGGLGAGRRGSREWSLDGAVVAARLRGRETTVVFAPAARLAREVAAAPAG